jgi:hypothetical protein
VITLAIWSKSNSRGTPPKKANAASRPVKTARMSSFWKNRSQSSRE